ncbi:hypothetical protein K1719_044669 [Acacia pycnantha]|nr:hypothetical protein K1719_044669 [Acacia pycnantha]
MASMEVGAFVDNCQVLRNAKGTTSGIVPCLESDILVGLEVTVEDGVDVISMFVGSNHASPFFNDNISIGSFVAFQKGIFVNNSAGNSGPTVALFLSEPHGYSQLRKALLTKPF